MSSLSHYYSRAKGGLMNVNPKEAAQLAEDWLIAGGTGAVLGLISASIGGLDKQVAGMNVPVDGLAAAGLALVGLGTGIPELKTASIAAGGSASTRVFSKFFTKALGAHGDFSEMGYGYAGELPSYQGEDQFNYGWGQDALVEAAANL